MIVSVNVIRVLSSVQVWVCGERVWVLCACTCVCGRGLCSVHVQYARELCADNNVSKHL